MVWDFLEERWSLGLHTWVVTDDSAVVVIIFVMCTCHMGPFIFILRLRFIHLKVLLNLTVMPLVISVTSVNCEGSPRLWSKRVTPLVVKCPGKVAVMCRPYWLLCDFRWPKADNVCWAVIPSTQGAGLWHSNLFSSYRQMALLRGAESMNMASVCESAKQCRSLTVGSLI